jgi:glucan-binding YG repeat protein
MQEISSSLKELKELVEFLNYDREILMIENKRLKDLVETNPWEKRYYEVLAKLKSKQNNLRETKSPVETKLKYHDKDLGVSKIKVRNIKVSLKSQTVSALASPINNSKSLAKTGSGVIGSKLDVTITKAHNTIISCKNNRPVSKQRVFSPTVSLNSSRFGTPKRSKKK